MSLTKEDLNKISKLLDQKLDEKLKPIEIRFDKLEFRMNTLETEFKTFRIYIEEKALPWLGAEIAKVSDKFTEMMGNHIMNEYPHTHKEYRAMVAKDSSS